jgi:hypothetical protein
MIYGRQRRMFSAEFNQQVANLVSQATTLRIRELTANDPFGAGREVVSQHVALHAPERGDTGTNLVRNFDAVALLLDHLLDPADLSLNAFQAG